MSGSPRLWLRSMIDAVLKILRPPPRKQPCEECGSPGATYGPDPYAEEILNNDKSYWLCADCRRKSAREI